MRVPRRLSMFFLCLLCLVWMAFPAVSLASQSVTCPEAGLILTVPDDFEVVPLSPEDDPDLRLLLESKRLSVSVYVSFVGSAMTDPQSWVLTGDETDTGVRKLAGKKLVYVSGNSDGESYYTCFWLCRGSGASLDFRWIEKNAKKAKKTVEEILSSIEWMDD